MNAPPSNGNNQQGPPPLPRKDGLESYQTVAETVGLVPSLRMKDNLIQGIAVAIGSLIGLGAGFLIGRDLQGALLGLVVGLIASTLISGAVLMVLGLIRATRKRK